MKRRKNLISCACCFPAGQTWAAVCALTADCGTCRGRECCYLGMCAVPPHVNCAGGRKPAAFSAGWGTLLVSGQDTRDENVCCKTTQTLHERKIAETRARQSLCCPQSWDAHPANQTKCFMREWDRLALVHCYSFPWFAQVGCTESVTRYH